MLKLKEKSEGEVRKILPHFDLLAWSFTLIGLSLTIGLCILLFCVIPKMQGM